MNSRRADAPRKVIAVVPTLLTLLNLCLGWLAVVRAFEGKPSLAALFVVLAAVLDKLDGFVARATDTSSEFGAELDSLADIVSFGVAPAMISISWGLSSLGRVGVAAAFLFTACGALRLARFNVLPPALDKRWFVGLPIPMAAGMIVSVVLSHALAQDSWNARLQDRTMTWFFLALLVGTALLMVSRLRYYAFKDMTVSKRWRMVVPLAAIGVLALLVAAPEVALPLYAAAYLLHGPVLRVFRPGLSAGVPADTEHAS